MAKRFRLSAEEIVPVVPGHGSCYASDRITVDDGGSNLPLTAWQDAEAHDLHSIVVADPSALFVDLANNDYHLSLTSAAINAGMNSGAASHTLPPVILPYFAAVA